MFKQIRCLIIQEFHYFYSIKCNKTTSVIHLPWKNDTVKVGNRITHDESLNGTLSKDIGTHDCKASSSIEGKSSPTTRTRMEAGSKAKSESNRQQESKQGLCKVPSKGSKIQRNCPKKMIFCGSEKVQQV